MEAAVTESACLQKILNGDKPPRRVFHIQPCISLPKTSSPLNARKPMSVQLWLSRSAAGRLSRCAPDWKRLDKNTVSPSTILLYSFRVTRVFCVQHLLGRELAVSLQQAKSEQTTAHTRSTLHLCLWAFMCSLSVVSHCVHTRLFWLLWSRLSPYITHSRTGFYLCIGYMHLHTLIQNSIVV